MSEQNIKLHFIISYDSRLVLQISLFHKFVSVSILYHSL